MRKFMLVLAAVAAVMVAGNAYAAKNSIDGFLGMTWGTPLDEVKNNMTKKDIYLKAFRRQQALIYLKGNFLERIHRFI